jgi:ribosomal protein S18 acetylase RimI-like enzyme
MSTPQSVTLRPATADDEKFLRRLFASTREAEFASLPEAQREMLMTMQFNLQWQQYSAGYPQAENNIILLDDQAVGRLLVDEADREITLVDIALLPAHRNLGIGTYLLDQLLARAAKANKAVRLHVFKTNPAQLLYERLGFSKIGDDGMYLEMLCPPGVGVAS